MALMIAVMVVFAATVSFVMMITGKIGICRKSSVRKGFCDLSYFAACPANHPYTESRQGVYRPAPYPAAY